MNKLLSLFLLLFAVLHFCVDTSLQAQPPTFPVNGVHDDREGLYAFTNATIYTSYNKKVDNATLLIRKGEVVSAGAGVSIPKGAVVVDLKGMYIYPSFIDLYSEYGVPKAKKNERKWNETQLFTSNKKGAYGWNSAIKSEFIAADHFVVDKKAVEDYHKAGFGAVLSHQHDGIARGAGVFVLLGDEQEQEMILKDRAAAHYSFKKGQSPQSYPSSLMGSIALLRQTYYDAEWYEQVKNEEEYNITLDHFNQLQKLPQIFEVRDRLSILRADKVGDEFGVQYIIKGNGDEYQRIDAIKKTGASLILPLKFPDAYDVEDPFDAMNVNLAKMKHWELAPANAAMLRKAGVELALTPSGLKDMGSFHSNLRKAIKRGLSEEDALKALTYTPAKMLKMDGKIGSLEKGKVANFLICSGNIFEKDTKIHENWIGGEQHLLKDWRQLDITGDYDLKIGKGVVYDVAVGGKAKSPKPEIVINDSTKIKITHKLQQQSISLSFSTKTDSVNHEKIGNGFVRLSGWTSPDGKNWKGNGQLANGEWISWTATKVAKRERKKKDDDKDKGKDKDKDGKEKDKDKDKDKDKKETYGDLVFPFNPYGWKTEDKPKTETVLIQGATVWTNEKDGILEEADVLIKNGKIAQIGENIKLPSGAKKVDGKGKHLTCGIVDEHSHIAISRGVNEGTQASSAEVSIADVVNSEDVNIYRQLAGGVTTAQLLHGSANPIGGQSALIKFRWGEIPEDMKFKGADGFIKFALGENVKQSNWGDHNTVRFPQTRMGVEQVYMDHFNRAKEYGEAMGSGSSKKKRKKKGSSGTSVRRDLELDILLEIINKKRFITCHSYVQSEITMLMRTAEHFGFNINTFTHILEGYKIADKMAEHGVAGSTFSDWWAYKYEVIDAIPHNGAILNEMGVVTSFNSDDAEMARRLNQEAAKAVKYGGVSEEEAWKFVTLNPAKMLHIDDKVGSIKVGKDADVVLWTEHPMSIYAKPVQTYVDGICYFDLEKDLEKRKWIQAERNRLIQKMLEVKAGGGKTQKAKPSKKRLYHCNSEGEQEEIDIYHLQHNGH